MVITGFWLAELVISRPWLIKGEDRSALRQAKRYEMDVDGVGKLSIKGLTFFQLPRGSRKVPRSSFRRFDDGIV